MTDTLPPLPEPCNKGSTGFGQLWNPLYTADQLCAYGAACAAAVGAERDALRAGRDKVTSVVYEFHYAMKDAGWHPGRTDDNLCDIIRDKGKELGALRTEVEQLTNELSVINANCEGLIEHRRNLKAEVKRLRSGEPVAPAPSGEPLGYWDATEGEVKLLAAFDHGALKDGAKVYAAPPRQEPLTPEQIAEAQDMLPKVGEREDCYCSIKGSTLRALMGAAGITPDKGSEPPKEST